MFRRPSKLRMTFCIGATLAMVLCAMTAGCSRSNRSPLAPATGKVLFNGKPLQFGMVVFVSDVGRPANGIIQSDGTFRLSTYGKDDGAVIGHHRVAVTCMEQPKGSDPNGEPSPGPSLIPLKYNDYKTSGLEATVKDKNEPFVFELTGKAP